MPRRTRSRWLAIRAAIRQSGIAAPGRVHVALGEPHPPLAVHRGQVHLARGRGRQPDVAGLPDLGRHDVDVDREQPALADGAHDRIDRRLPVAVGDAVHGVLHQVGAPLVDALELHARSASSCSGRSPRCGARRPCPRSGACRRRPRAGRHGRRQAGHSLPGARRGARSRRPGRPTLPVASARFTRAALVR